MTEDIYEGETVSVTRFHAGTGSRAGRRTPGRAYQINETDKWVELTQSEAIAVARAILDDVERGK